MSRKEATKRNMKVGHGEMEIWEQTKK
jgi:hypothetical protein